MEFLFYTKKCITFFIEPLGLVLFSAALACYFLWKGRYAQAKLLSSLSLGLLLLFSYPPFSNFLVKNLEDAYPMFESDDLNISYIHVLGSGSNDDLTQPLSSRIGSEGMKRVIEGILIHRRHPQSRVIFTGYAGHGTLASAKANSELAQALGVTSEKLIIDSGTRDTKEEALFTKGIVGESPFVLVTSATHMPRAMKLFEELGMHPIAAPTAFRRYDARLLSAPAAEALENSRLAMHEYIGRLWAALVP